ncbi:MAG TPA: TRAP transporter small permease [Deltaproteobacteria bacterium]|nr:TRAP transporter small permease [Deltaproteobacteria bacterium]HIJ37132.1 TRAP transporter small permease [Deltaproteobacteria bacterium]HIJ42194.1 TRAP transporter small permease [Deltaproteobacteria bacterium]
MAVYLSFVGMFFLIPMMLLTTADVLGRAIWSRPIPGAMELSSYILSIFILLGVAYTHQVKGQVRVTMLVSKLPRRLAVLLEILTTLISLFIISILAWQGWVVGMEEKSVSDMWRIPQLPFRLLVSVAGFFLALELVLDLLDLIKKLGSKIKNEEL